MWGGELPIICANNGNVTRTTTFVNREYSFCWEVTFSPGSFHVRSFRNMQYLGWLLMDSHWYSWIDKEHFYPLCTAVNIIGNIVVNQMGFLFHNHRRHNTKKRPNPHRAKDHLLKSDNTSNFIWCHLYVQHSLLCDELSPIREFGKQKTA